MNLGSSEASGPDCIPVVILKNCEPSWTFQYMSERVLFSRSLEDLMGDSVFKNVGERSTAKNYHPVSFLSVVSKVFEQLVNDSIVDNLEKFDLFG